MSEKPLKFIHKIGHQCCMCGKVDVEPDVVEQGAKYLCPPCYQLVKEEFEKLNPGQSLRTDDEPEVKKGVGIGDIVKIRLMDGENSERIWAIVKDFNVENQTLDVELNNTPVSPAFKLGEKLTVPVSFVLDIFKDEPEKGA